MLVGVAFQEGGEGVGGGGGGGMGQCGHNVAENRQLQSSKNRS